MLFFDNVLSYGPCFYLILFKNVQGVQTILKSSEIKLVKAKNQRLAPEQDPSRNPFQNRGVFVIEKKVEKMLGDLYQN